MSTSQPPPSCRDLAQGRAPETVHLAGLFDYAHLPPHLRSVSIHIHNLAALMLVRVPDGFELWAGLRKLVEAKDCFVRGALPPEGEPSRTA